MKIKVLALLLLLFATVPTFAQDNFYRSIQNPYYWANHKPYEGYWQQDVHYKIKASIDEKTDILAGHEEITYWNNSPHTLNKIYFHLYQNAYQPDSYMGQLIEQNKLDYPFGTYESQGLCIKVESVKAKGKELKTTIDNTILKVILSEPLKPGEKITLELDFKTYFDISARWRRMRVFNAYGFKHYNGGHWYPRISVFDRKFGWTADQHMGHEFYGDYGTYDVELTFANNFVVDATGILQNSQDVMPDELRKKLDISNFKDKPLFSPPSVIVPYDSTKQKTWKFHAENVHDFAFLADPTYRIGEVEWNGVKVVALAMEPHAARWQDAAEVTAEIIKIYSEDIGMYPYPKIIVSDAQSGMEYPMLTMDNGFSPGYAYIFAHEVGHNWFFGAIGNNETYRSVLDEGFTQFLTVWALEKLAKTRETEYKEGSRYDIKFTQKQPIRLKYGYERYLDHAIQTNGAQLNTHSDYFDSKEAYGMTFRQTYNKGTTMLYNLQYVLGDELFLDAMKHYFEQWKFCHPYLEDFRQSIIDYTGVDLNWFFDQWLNTNKTIDYAVKSVKRTKGDKYEITFKRKGEMQMPIDFTVTDKEGNKINYHIPNRDFIKKTDAIVLPKWYGWNYLNKEYAAIVTVPESIDYVTIDTTNRLADINMINNCTKYKVDLYFDRFIEQPSSWTHYDLQGRPDIWWNGYDGVKFGFHLHGNYMKVKHQIEANAWFNMGAGSMDYYSWAHMGKFDPISFRLKYRNQMDIISKNVFLNFKAIHLDGVDNYGIGLERWNKEKDFKTYIDFNLLTRKDTNKLNYLNYIDDWSVPEDRKYHFLNNTITIGAEKVLKNSVINLIGKSAAFGSDFSYTSFSLEAKDNRKIWKLKLKSRVFSQYTFGNSMPKESALYLAGANPEEMLENAFTRSYGFFPSDWFGYGNTSNHFHYGGGLNLRGYAGYLAPFINSSGEMIFTYRGHSGLALNTELEFDGLVPFRPKFLRKYFKLNTYFFGDGGIINYTGFEHHIAFADFRIDAGLGTALTIKQWGPFKTIKPLTLRFDMPFLLTRKPFVDDEHLQFRWIFGVSRAF